MAAEIMSNKNNNVVGILRLREIQATIQALEGFAKETRARVDQTPDSELNEEWEKLQSLAVSAEGALGAFRLIVDRARKINDNPDTSFTVRWEGSLGQAMNAAGIDFKPEPREKKERGEFDEYSET